MQNNSDINTHEENTCHCCDSSIQSIQNSIPSDDILIALAESFKVFGDSSRIKIISALQTGELCVNYLVEATNMTQSAVSHQLRILRSAKLVKTRRDGKNIYYSLDDDHVKKIMELGLEHVSEKENHIID